MVRVCFLELIMKPCCFANLHAYKVVIEAKKAIESSDTPTIYADTKNQIKEHIKTKCQAH